MSRPLYERTQVAWLTRLAFITAAAVLAVRVATLSNTSLGPHLTIAAAALALAIAGVLFSRLTLRVERDALLVFFGYGWPRRRITWPELLSVETTRTRWYNGWGIRLTQRGWLWNVSGFDAVSLQLSTGKTFLVGTDAPHAVLNAVVDAMAQAKVDATARARARGAHR